MSDDAQTLASTLRVVEACRHDIATAIECAQLRYPLAMQLYGVTSADVLASIMRDRLALGGAPPRT